MTYTPEGAIEWWIVRNTADGHSWLESVESNACDWDRDGFEIIHVRRVPHDGDLYCCTACSGTCNEKHPLCQDCLQAAYP